MSRSQRAYQLIDAAAIVANVYSSRQTPTHEAQLRPLAGLSPPDQRAIWELAAATAPDGIIIAKHVKATADTYFGRPQSPRRPLLHAATISTWMPGRGTTAG